MLIIQIDKYTLQLAEVSYNGKKTLINKMRLFRLPENLENGGCSKDTAASADFVSNCIERGRLAKGKALLFLDDSSVMRKEYTHENSKPAHLLSLACLEADAILPENEGSFIIENEWYGPRKNREGLQTSVIYAANEDLVSGLTKHLKKRGILLKAVFPSALAHTDLIRSLLNPMISGKEFADRTVVSVCFSDQEMRIAVFHNGELIHQRIDEQSMQDFYRNVALAYHIPQTETESFCLKNGFNRNADINRINADAYERMEEAAESMLLKFVRSINIILNSEGLNLDHIIISGTPSAFPGFAEFISKCLKVDCSVIDEYSQRLSPIVELGDELKNRSNLFHKLVLLRGADYKKNKD